MALELEELIMHLTRSLMVLGLGALAIQVMGCTLPASDEDADAEETATTTQDATKGGCSVATATSPDKGAYASVTMCPGPEELNGYDLRFSGIVADYKKDGKSARVYARWYYRSGHGTALSEPHEIARASGKDDWDNVSFGTAGWEPQIKVCTGAETSCSAWKSLKGAPR